MVVQGAFPYLTPREQQVLDLMLQGLADKEIAVALGTSTKTKTLAYF